MKIVYSKPSMQEILLESEGMIAASSDKVPVDPNQPGMPAANKREWPWSNNAWENK
jgi:hypothetical protein